MTGGFLVGCLLACVCSAAKDDFPTQYHKVTWVDTLPPEWFLPGTMFLEHGFDIIQGVNRAMKVFHFKYGGSTNPYHDDDKDTPQSIQFQGKGEVFWYPDDTDCRRKEECAFDTSTKKYSSVMAYVQSAGASLSGGLGSAGPVAFSASASVKSLKKLNQNDEKEMEVTKAQCLTSSIVQLKPELYLDELFSQRVQELKEWQGDDEDIVMNYIEFYDDFGTHFYRACDFGGELELIKIVDKLSSSEHDSIDATGGGSVRNEKKDITEAPETHEPCIHICSEEKTDPPTDAPDDDESPDEYSIKGGAAFSSMEAMNQKKQSIVIKSLGGQPGSFSSAAGASLAWGPWAETVLMAPVPLNPQLSPLHELISDPVKKSSLRNALSMYYKRKADPFTTTYRIFFTIKKEFCAKPSSKSQSLLQVQESAGRRLHTHARTRERLTRRRQGIVKADSPCIVVSLFGKLGVVKDWIICPQIDNWNEGTIEMSYKISPNIGKIRGLQFTEERFDKFDHVRIVDETFGETVFLKSKATPAKKIVSDKKDSLFFRKVDSSFVHALEGKVASDDDSGSKKASEKASRKDSASGATKKVLKQDQDFWKRVNGPPEDDKQIVERAIEFFSPAAGDSKKTVEPNTGQNRYDIIFENSHSHQILNSQSVKVTVEGPKGARQIWLSRYQESPSTEFMFKKSPKDDKILTKVDESIVNDFVENGRVKNFPEHSLMAYGFSFSEGIDIGIPSTLTLGLTADAEDSRSITAQPLSVQTSVAKTICKSLLNKNDQMSSCQKVVDLDDREYSLSRISSMYAAVELKKSDCEVVFRRLQLGNGNFKCSWSQQRYENTKSQTFASAVGGWEMLEVGGKQKKISNCGRYDIGCQSGGTCDYLEVDTCEDLIGPEFEDFMKSDSGYESKHVDVGRVWIMSYKDMLTKEVRFETQVRSNAPVMREVL